MNISRNIFRFILVAIGAVTAFVALNVALGGLETLGWQGPTDYFQVTDPDAFDIRDSHARYYGGVYVGVAAILLLGATNVGRYRQTLSFVFGLIFLGGLARFSQGQFDVMTGPDMVVSTFVELVGMPLLFVWLRSLTSAERTAAPVLAH